MGRVVVVSHLFPSRGRPQAGTFVAGQVCGLLHAGADLQVVAPLPAVPVALSRLKAKWTEYYSTPQRTTVSGIDVIYARWLCLPFESAFAVSGRLLAAGLRANHDARAALDEAALLHGHTLLPDGDCVRRLSRDLHIPYVVTVHGSDLLVYPFRDRATHMASAKVLDEASRVIFVSQHLVEFAVKEFSMDRAKAAVIPNGFDHTIFFQDGSVEHGDKVRFLYVGRLMRGKGVLDLIEAIALLRSNELIGFARADFTLLGDGSDRSAAEQSIAAYHLASSVHVAGAVSHEVVADYMRESDFLVLPSWSEGMPTVIPEAMACGLPVIATTVGGIPEIVTVETGILVEPHHADQLAEALVLALQTSFDRDEIAADAQEYEWGHIAERIQDVYASVLVGIGHGSDRSLSQ
jgi:teichuronic acid biosynthesis glycosyltransferase TuaC